MAGTLDTASLELALRSTNWIDRLSAVSQERVRADSFERNYAPREFVARKGDLSTTWIGVMDGLLKVSSVTPSGRNVMFSAVPNGSWVGEGSVIKRELRRYDLTAMRATRVLHVPRPTFMWLLETSLEFSRFIVDHLNERAGQFIATIEASRISDPAGRVAYAILNLLNPVLYPKAGPFLKISQEEIGELAGMSRPTTNTAIHKLKELQLVQPEYGGLLVLDVDRLWNFAHQDHGD